MAEGKGGDGNEEVSQGRAEENNDFQEKTRRERIVKSQTGKCQKQFCSGPTKSPEGSGQKRL